MHALFLVEIGIIGFLAQIIDGILGMGYGVSSSCLLIFLGVPPVIASASVHTSETFTAFASGVSHFKLKNVKKELLMSLISFGVIGGFLGASGLVKIPVKPIKPLVGLVLLSMGAVILYRFSLNKKIISKTKPYSVNKLRALGFFAALIDAIGGGGWGPICTPALVVTGTEPNKAVGSVDFSEFFVTLAITLTFVIFIGAENFRWDFVLALLIGGIIAAPLAAYSCKKFTARALGIFVGIIVIILSLRILLM